jgi:hypothetical protein
VLALAQQQAVQFPPLQVAEQRLHVLTPPTRGLRVRRGEGRGQLRQQRRTRL